MTITPLMPVYPRCAVRPVRGEGAYLIGERGERYLDFASGIAVNLLGHGHPHLTKAIQDQAATLMHVSNLYGSPQGEAYAARLVENTFADTVFLTNSGAEAVECAIKTARRYHHAKGQPEKHTLITFSNAFHGRTMATIRTTTGSSRADLSTFTLRVGTPNLPSSFPSIDQQARRSLVRKYNITAPPGNVPWRLCKLRFDERQCGVIPAPGLEKKRHGLRRIDQNTQDRSITCWRDDKR